VAKKKAAKAKQPSFEESLQQLEAIVAKLEDGKLGLADSLEQYEQGVQHLRACYEMLSQAERRIELVSGLDSAGRPRTEPFEDPGGADLDEKGSARSRRRSMKSARSSKSEVDDASSLF